MFSNTKEIIKEFPNYSLDYQEISTFPHTFISYSFNSKEDDWSGNLYDFYFRVYRKMQQDIKVPFALDESGLFRIDDTDAHKALRKVLLNLLVDTDYDEGGIEIVKKFEELYFAYPLNFKINLKDPITKDSNLKNLTLMKLFDLIKIVDYFDKEKLDVYSIWEKHGWIMPSFEESHNPNRTALTLTFKKAPINYTNKTYSKKSMNHRKKILDYLNNHEYISASDSSSLLALKSTQARKILRDMAKDGILIAIGENRNRKYFINKR